MGRTVLTIVFIALAFWALRRLWRTRAGPTPQRGEPAFEKTRRCAQCGVHVSVRLAIERDGRHYCCREHLPE